MACYDGNYLVKYDPLIDKHIMERRKSRSELLTDFRIIQVAQPQLL